MNAYHEQAVIYETQQAVIYETQRQRRHLLRDLLIAGFRADPEGSAPEEIAQRAQLLFEKALAVVDLFYPPGG